ncbi:YgcG family protein [uncultured Lacinutrix sp.]|uniref:TPM domain-containing protein n=1 Tax=uncultured Lacinutrix sp. TaxID=574032 RepID=UPI002632AA27|nr:TPM domain-containing protein [uncultured Lacinutrix sp.]
MKKLCITTCLLLVVSCNNDTSKTSISDAVVQDYNDLFTATEEQKLSEKIINYEKLTTNQICIYTIDSIPNNEKILYHATNLAQRLGVGIKEKDNGLLILISYYDRDMAIATGYGVEKVITDSIAKTIIKQTIVPRFKDSLYFEGVTIGLDSIISKWK